MENAEGFVNERHQDLSATSALGLGPDVDSANAAVSAA
tara:strand:+ start:7044 stop:7157 length:114 start_codon:yes stop_codon:yes gene_type:complete